MNIALYTFLFISKIIENSLATLRLIVVSNGKKGLGAILQFATSLVWIISTGIVVSNINKDPLKIIVFCFGCLVGSYLGSILEQKIAMGDNLILCITNTNDVENHLRDRGYAVTKTMGRGKEEDKCILFIMISRRKMMKTIDEIKKIDGKAMIISEVAKKINGGYYI